MLGIAALMAVSLSACSDDDDDIYPADSSSESDQEESIATQTVIMFFPWTGNLLSAFNTNIADLATVVENRGGLDEQRIVIYICQSQTTAHILEIVMGNDGCATLDTIATHTFSDAPYTTASGMAELLLNLEECAPAESYAMIIGCHGMGWLPAGTSVSAAAGTKGQTTGQLDLPTRYFGHSTDSSWQCDISVLAAGIEATGVTMDYILFDACYMANIETACELRDATQLLIASPTEVMAAGVPYSVAGSYLLDMDTAGFCDAFTDYYLATSTPYAVMSVIDCSQTEAMAEVIREINATCDGSVTTSGLQAYDGLSPHLFFDLGDYAQQLCSGDSSLSTSLDNALAALVPYCRYTPKFYSAYNKSTSAITTCSGITTSAPSSNDAAADWQLTQWAIGTAAQ